MNRCDTFSVESQLRSKTLRGQGHMFRMPDDTLPKKLFFGEVKGARPPGCPRSSFNDAVLRDCPNCHINRAYRDAQNKLVWRDKTCLARTCAQHALTFTKRFRNQIPHVTRVDKHGEPRASACRCRNSLSARAAFCVRPFRNTALSTVVL